MRIFSKPLFLLVAVTTAITFPILSSSPAKAAGAVAGGTGGMVDETVGPASVFSIEPSAPRVDPPYIPPQKCISGTNALPGYCCQTLGTTKLSDNKDTLIACLQYSASDATLLWKATAINTNKNGGVKVEQVTGGYTESSGSGRTVLLSTKNIDRKQYPISSSSGTFAGAVIEDAFEVVAYGDNQVSRFGPFNGSVRLGKGLRCRDENGWYLASCGYINGSGVNSTAGDWDHGPYANACIAGYGQFQELYPPVAQLATDPKCDPAKCPDPDKLDSRNILGGVMVACQRISIE